MRTSSEGKRGCGYRQGGGLYLCSDGVGQGCDLLPHPVEVCPCCGTGIRPARGYTWVSPDMLLPHHADGWLPGNQGRAAGQHKGCPLNHPGLMGERAGLLWIGRVHYATPAAWIEEGERMGFSRRIAQVPRDFVAGETWVLVGHRDCIQDGLVCVSPDEYAGTMVANMEGADKVAATWPDDVHTVWADRYVPGVFHLWLPERIEYVVRGDESPEELQAYEARGIEPVQVVHVADAPTLEGTT